MDMRRYIRDESIRIQKLYPINTRRFARAAANMHRNASAMAKSRQAMIRHSNLADFWGERTKEIPIE